MKRYVTGCIVFLALCFISIIPQLMGEKINDLWHSVLSLYAFCAITNKITEWIIGKEIKSHE